MHLARNIATASINLPDVLHGDAQHVFIAGQNLDGIATSKDIKDAIKFFLAKADGRKVDMLMCDVNFRPGVQAWSRVHPESGDYNYETHLRQSVQELLQLQREVGENRLGIRVTDLLPFSGWFVDPEEHSATMVMTLIVPDSRDTHDRPQLIVTREENKAAFDFCWTRLRNAYRPAGLSRVLAPLISRIFLSHGRSTGWRDLKDFLVDRLGLQFEEFNRESPAGLTTPERLLEMLDNCCFAFIVMTAEDEQGDTSMRARQNVVHEAGMAQARYGFRRAIVLLEEGCDEFSNIHGLGQIRFPANNMAAKFDEIRQVLEREGILRR